MQRPAWLPVPSVIVCSDELVAESPMVKPLDFPVYRCLLVFVPRPLFRVFEWPFVLAAHTLPASSSILRFLVFLMH
jgi:hypothetical protein